MSDEIKGKIDNLKGRVKQAVGAATGNKKMEAEGAAERIKGAGEEKIGQAKSKLDDTTDAGDEGELEEEDEEEDKVV
jgi:uncharacterized protein YjbJ (UPF0337 family)